jgi:glycosyltransferase involved in cell wall biosynthesis
MTPTVSVIIPSYNSAPFVGAAIESALRQTHRPREIIVVNDGSTDDTEFVLKNFADQITVVRQDNAGLPSARNAGLRIAKGDWIAFLDADDIWHPRKVDLQLIAASKRPGLGLIGTRTFDFPREPTPEITTTGEVELIRLERLLVRNHFTASSVIVRSDVARRVGEFDPPLPNAEDWDYWQRAGEIASLANLLLPLTGYRQVAGSLSRRPVAMEEGVRTVIEKLDERNAWGERPWLRRRALAHLHLSIAHMYGEAGDERTALMRLCQSMAACPMPLPREDVPASFARPRRAAVLMMRMLGWMPGESGTGQKRRAA